MTTATSGGTKAASELEVSIEDVYPRNPQNRYRIYRLRAGTRKRDELSDILATTDTPQGIGLALVTFREEGEIEDTDAIGVLDCHGIGKRNPLGEDGCYTLAGSWIVNPYGRGGGR